MDLKNVFESYLNAPYTESLAKDFEAAVAALGQEPLPVGSLQEALQAIVPARRHMAFARKAGLFLSAVRRRLPADQTLDLSGLEEVLLDCVGVFGRNFDLTVKGNLGAFTGAHMESGTLTVEGDTGDQAGAEMKGGTLHVKGLAENNLGRSMVGGEILVERNAYDLIGNSMVGGRIVVRGNAGYSAGYRMVGGAIDIRDLTWDQAGEEMVGGRVQIGGHIGRELGLAMAGGELALNEKNEGAQRTKASGGKLVILKRGKKTA